MQKPPHRIDQTLTLVVLAVLIIGCLLVLRPFLSAVLWAVILCATTWPVYLRLKHWLHGRDTLSALIMTLLIAAVVLAPFVIVGFTLADNAARAQELTHELIEKGPPAPPEWVGRIPLVGERLFAYLGSFAHDSASVIAELKKYVEPVRRVVVASGATLAQGVLQLTLSVLIAFFFFRDGETATKQLRGAVARIAPLRGVRLLDVAGNTVRSVVYGILGTALAQGVLMAIGLWIAGFSAAPLLGLVTFFLSPVPVGPPLVWIPAGVWLMTQGQMGWGIFIIAWGALVVSSVDNFLKPMIISRGSAMPFILVLLGVLGGVVAFGFIGAFLGPVLLALGFALLKEWIAEAATPASQTGADGAGQGGLPTDTTDAA